MSVRGPTVRLVRSPSAGGSGGAARSPLLRQGKTPGTAPGAGRKIRRRRCAAAGSGDVLCGRAPCSEVCGGYVCQRRRVVVLIHKRDVDLVIVGDGIAGLRGTYILG